MLMWDPLPKRDPISLESECPREAGCFHDLPLCSPIFRKTIGQIQTTALFPSHLPSDLASEGKALWRKGVAEFREALSNKCKIQSPVDTALLMYRSQSRQQSHFLGNSSPTPQSLLFADQKLEGRLLSEFVFTTARVTFLPKGTLQTSANIWQQKPLSLLLVPTLSTEWLCSQAAWVQIFSFATN